MQQPYEAGFETRNDCLPLDGLREYAFCPRLFGLSSVEHLPAGDTESLFIDTFSENTAGAESIPLLSKLLGLQGMGKVFFEQEEGGILLADRPGRWRPSAVLMRSGQPKPEPFERVWLCAQTICLEEMFSTRIGFAVFHHITTDKRELLAIDNALRENTIRLSREMKQLVSQKKSVSFCCATKSRCLRCPISSFCLPQLSSTPSVRDYLQSILMNHQKPI